MIIDILIVEDDKTQVKLYESSIKTFNKKDESIQFVPVIVNDLSTAMNAIHKKMFDAAIIDLNLNGGHSLDFEGNKVIKEVKNNLRFPVYVITGTPNEIDRDLGEQNLFFKVLGRDIELNSLFEEITNIVSTGITKLLGGKGKIEESLQNIFWKHLSGSFNYWIGKNDETALLRHIAIHLQEQLQVDTDGNFEEFHAPEIYFIPSIKDVLHTGDVININGSYYLLITPACDIVIQKDQETPKAEKITLLGIREFDVKNICLISKRDKDKKIIKNADGVREMEFDKGKIKEYVNNSSYRYHYLPSSKDSSGILNYPDGYLIDFQDILTVNYDKRLSHIASVSPPFIKDIISRFSAYYSRQGQPTFEQKSIIDGLLEKYSDKNK